MLSALQSANPRLVASAKASGGEEWYNRIIDGLSFPPNGSNPHNPSIGEILRRLRWHEFQRDKEIMGAFGISAKFDVAGEPSAS